MANTSPEFLVLKSFFDIAKFPASIQLDQGVFIPDVKLFVDRNLECLGSGDMNELAAAGRYYRMNQLKTLLSK
jgi:hypothetical protein